MKGKCMTRDGLVHAVHKFRAGEMWTFCSYTTLLWALTLDDTRRDVAITEPDSTPLTCMHCATGSEVP